jgi:hypothetical protein
MKNLDLILNIDPLFLGSTESVQLFAFDLNRNIERVFSVKSNYHLNLNDNNYRVASEDPFLELQVSEFIENNWHGVSPYANK